MRRPLFALLLLALVLLATSTPVDLRAQQPVLRIQSLVVRPETVATGDVATVEVVVVDRTGAPRSGLALHASVWPTTSPAATAPEAIAEVRTVTEQEPGRYQLSLPLNEAGTWRILVRASDGIETTQAEADVFVAPRLASPPATTDAVLLRGNSWVSVLRFDPDTGSVVRLLGETVVRAAERTYVVRRSASPVGSISRLYGGAWGVSLAWTDALTGEEQRFDFDPVRASLQPGSTSTPALSLAVVGFTTQPRLLVYRAARLGESWRADLFLLDLESGTLVAQRSLPGALQGTQVVPRLEVAASQRIVVLERALSLDGSGEVRLSLLAFDTLEPEVTRRWLVASVASGDVDCLANPDADGGVLGDQSVRWFAWCHDVTGPWLGLWDLATGALVARVNADPATTVALPAPQGELLYLVDVQRRRIAAIDAETGVPYEGGSSPDVARSERSWWQRVAERLVSPVRAAETVALRAALSPDGRHLYVVYPLSGDLGDGLWVYDTATLQPVTHLLPGWLVRGVVVSAQETVVAVAQRPRGDQLIVLAGETPRLLVTLPERVSEVWS
jgi:hypothetical protein